MGAPSPGDVVSTGDFVAVGEGLAYLAAAHGVAIEYWDQAGSHVGVSATTVEAVLVALGVDLTGDDAIERGLEEVRLSNWRRMLPPVFVGRRGEQRRLWVHVTHGQSVSVHVDLENGERVDLQQLDWYVEPIALGDRFVGEASFAVPPDLPIGWHSATASTVDEVATMPLVMTPERLDAVALTGERQWGFMTQLYATRSRSSWGLGDLADCEALAAWSGNELGAGFLLINPLHAASPRPPMTPSPYLPVTRRFTNPIYLHVENVGEFEELAPPVRERLVQLAQTMQRRNGTDEYLDRDAVWAAKRVALESIFSLGLSCERSAEFAEYRAFEGQGLRDFATWCAISDTLGSEADNWPSGFERPGTEEVAEFCAAHAELIDFHCWLQWQMDQQLARTQLAAKAAGMAIGLLQDLAVGVHPEGADAWSMQEVLVRGVSVGAPPDMYNQVGQDWSQPPWHPAALAEAAFVPYRDMLRTVLRHAGGLRIDHVLGLFRLWFVPAGMPPNAGTFVKLDHDAMLGILCLEAQRAGALVVGEDLGTVEDWVQEVLADRGIVGTSILWFEADSTGNAKPPSEWRHEVLASVSVHDLPPTAGFLRDEHVRIRADLGLLTHPVEDERAASARERESWAKLLIDDGFMPPDVDLATDAGMEEFVIALHRAVAASPARLIGVALPDVFGDRRAQNQPGTDQEYPNWRVPMTDSAGAVVVLEDLFAKPELMVRLVGAVRREQRNSERLGLML